jgi:uncharacterized Zn finger protein (UPF0148 family)
MLKRASKRSIGPGRHMSSLKKRCHKCGMPLGVGVAQCAYCGAKVGTLFSESDAAAVVTKGKRKPAIHENIDRHDRIEKAQDWANNSLILALSSFFCPGIGFVMGVAAIILGAMASRALKAGNVEDGRGSAAAGLIIGALGLIAQGGYIVYILQSGKLPFVG